jgi:hypothetical protein
MPVVTPTGGGELNPPSQSLIPRFPQGGNMTVAQMMAMILRWLRDDEEPDVLADVINSATANLWDQAMVAQVSKFMSAPVQLQINQGDEQNLLVTIPDPAGAPTLGVITAAQNLLPARTYTIAFTLVAPEGGETNLSATATQAVAVGQLATCAAPAYVAGAMGWNCYAADAAGRLSRQNSEPLAFNSSVGVPFVFQEPQGGFTDLPDNPPPPFENSTADFVSYIRHMEVQMPDQTWRTYESVDIASIAMRRFERGIGTASPYQHYAYDFFNNNRIEIRPAAGANLSPRIFFVVRPPRLRFLSSKIFFKEISAQSYILYRSLQLLAIQLNEYTGAEQWGKQADDEAAKFIGTLTAENRNKARRVTPFMR